MARQTKYEDEVEQVIGKKILVFHLLILTSICLLKLTFDYYGKHEDLFLIMPFITKKTRLRR